MFAQPVLRPLNPSFGFVAASLTMSEKVEATVSKVCRHCIETRPGLQAYLPVVPTGFAQGELFASASISIGPLSPL